MKLHYYENVKKVVLYVLTQPSIVYTVQPDEGQY